MSQMIMKEQPSKKILASFRNSGESWIAVKCDVVHELVQRIIDDTTTEVTRDIAVVDIHYWINRNEVKPYTYMAKRWRWGEKRAYRLYVELGIYRDARAEQSLSNAGKNKPRGSSRGVRRESAGSSKGVGGESEGSSEGVRGESEGSDEGVIPGESEPKSSNEGVKGESEGSDEGVGGEQYVEEEDEEREKDEDLSPPSKGKSRKKAQQGLGPYELGYVHLQEIPPRIRNDPEVLAAWKNFVRWREHVHKKHIAVSRDSAVKLLNKLNRAEDPIAMIDQSIENEWTGLFPVRGSRTNGTGKRERIDYSGGF